MRRLALVLLLVSCGSPAEERRECPALTLERKGVCQAYGVEACAEGFRADGQGGCEAVLPAECAPSTIATPGDLACRPVGVDACAEGFTLDDGGCATSLPEPCDDLPSLKAGCVPTAECPTDAWPAGTEGALHVDRTYTGSDADGSVARPFATLAEALASATPSRNTVVLTDGKYEISTRIAQPLTIVGRCPERVSLFSRASAPVLTLASDVTLRGLTITGFGQGVRVESGTARIESCRVVDTGAEAIDVVRTGATPSLSVQHSIVARATGVGIAIEGAKATLQETAIRDTRVDASGGGGVGLGLRRVGTTRAEVEARALVITGSARDAIFVTGSQLSLLGSLIRATAQGSGPTGYGVYADATGVGPELVVRDSVIQATRGLGIAVFGGTATIDRTTVEGTTAGSADETFGGMLFGVDKTTKKPATATVTRCMVRNNQGTGISFGGASGEAASTIVRDTISSKRAQTGCGVRVQAASLVPALAPDVNLHDLLVERAQTCGFGLAAGSIHLSSVVVRDVAPDTTEKKYGTGVTAFVVDPSNQPHLFLERSRIERVHDAGVLAFGAQVEISATLIRDVLQREGGVYGHGVHLSADPTTGLGSTGTLKGCVVSGAFEAGVNVYQSSATIENTTIVETASSEGLFGDGITVGGIMSRDGVPLLPWREASLVIRRSRLHGSARAALSVFEAYASAEGVLATCNAFPFDVERLERDDAQPFKLVDLGGNACGCGDLGDCHAFSGHLAPVEVR